MTGISSTAKLEVYRDSAEKIVDMAKELDWSEAWLVLQLLSMVSLEDLKKRKEEIES